MSLNLYLLLEVKSRDHVEENLIFRLGQLIQFNLKRFTCLLIKNTFKIQ